MATEAQFLTTAPSGSDSHWMVPSSTSSLLILSSSQDQRAHASIFNDSAASLYLRFGGNGPISGLANGVYDVKLTSGTYYELPKPIYSGEIWGSWDVAGGFARVLSLGKAQ